MQNKHKNTGHNAIQIHSETFNMKTFLISMTTATALLSHGVANADDALAQKNNCYACHAKDKKILGPAFTEVAKRYGGKDDSVQMIAQTIRKGSTGKWGAIPMPGNEQLSESDATTLAKWIIGLK
jgi:cytochrome c